jgi:hypothetical protein
MQDSKVRAIATAIIQLNDFRNNWLNPPAQEIGVSISKTMLDKITLTNLYNALTIYREQFKGRQRDPRLWVATEHGNIISLENIETLDHIHVSLDHAVLDAYGWPHDLPDEQILERLLKLNLERAST